MVHDLSNTHGPRWDFHVMAQLEIREAGEGMNNDDLPAYLDRREDWQWVSSEEHIQP